MPFKARDLPVGTVVTHTEGTYKMLIISVDKDPEDANSYRILHFDVEDPGLGTCYITGDADDRYERVQMSPAEFDAMRERIYETLSQTIMAAMEALVLFSMITYDLPTYLGTSGRTIAGDHECNGTVH